MGRPRSNYICPKCHKQGYLEYNATRNGNCPNAEYRKYRRVVHYDSFTKKKSFCYVESIIFRLENREWLAEHYRRLNSLNQTEFQEEYLRFQQECRAVRDNIRLRKQIIKKVKLSRYQKESSSD